MNIYPITLSLDIPNDPDKIFEYTNAILGNVLDYIDLDLGYQRRIKLIIIELLTNSIKHSTEASAAFQLVIDEPHLSIHKIEKGLKIAFSSNSPQIPFENLDDILNISFSESNRHNIQPLGAYKFEFLKPAPEEELDITHMPEHFGLYIITLAADSFVYQYDPDLGENIYTVRLNF